MPQQHCSQIRDRRHKSTWVTAADWRPAHTFISSLLITISAKLTQGLPCCVYYIKETGDGSLVISIAHNRGAFFSCFFTGDGRETLDREDGAPLMRWCALQTPADPSGWWQAARYTLTTREPPPHTYSTKSCSEIRTNHLCLSSVCQRGMRWVCKRMRVSEERTCMCQGFGKLCFLLIFIGT